MRSLIIAAAAAFTLAATPVATAPITKTFDFVGSGLVGGIGINPFEGSATVTFDPTVTTTTTTEGVTLHHSSLTPASPFSWAYWTTTDTLYLGGSNGGAEGLYIGTTDFFVHIRNPASDNPVMSWLTYSTAAGPYAYTYTGSVTVSDGAAVPEPATWAMLLLGFLTAGSLLRRRRIAAA